ncbi:MAG: DUF2232 domain-containing protein [Sneathiella sp.]
MVKELVVAISLGILSTLLLSISIIGNDGGANYGAAFQSLALWTLSLVPLFISGLGFGIMSATASVITGAIVASLVLSPVFGLTYAILCGAPVLVIVRQALLWRGTEEEKFWYPTEYLLISWVGICVGLTIAAMVVVNMNDELQQGLITGFDQMLVQLKELKGVSPTLTAEEFVAMMPQFLGPMWGLFVLLSGSLAQGLLVRFGKNKRPTPKLTKMELPTWSALVFIAAVVLSIFLDGIWPILGAIVIALEIAFFLQGMAVIHVVSKRWNGRPILLGAIYMVLIIMLWPFLLVTILGMMENWIGFRRRFAVTTHQEED